MILLAACEPAPTPALPTPTPNPALTPYLFQSPTQTPAEQIPRPAATFTPLPSPTPFTYTIQEGDTLLVIGFRFSVTVDDIMSVNPGVNPNLLIVGSSLVIPLGEEGVVLIPSPTPAPLTIEVPDCYPSIDGGMWCFMMVENAQAVAVEGVTGEISLYAEDGEIIASEVAIPPLDRIFSGAGLPLVAYFPAPAPRDLYVQGLVLGAFQVDPERTRFLEAEAREVVIEVSGDQLAAQVSGLVSQVEREPDAPPGKLVVVAVAYGERGKVVGIRKWEGAEQEVDGGTPFAVTVFSLGPPILDVQVSAEIQPVEPQVPDPSGP